MLQDTVELTRALDARGWGPACLIGLCAGAWIALRATLIQPAGAVIALNPQLYWQFGDPIHALMADGRAARTPARLEEEEGRRTGRWDRLDRLGDRNPVGLWLDQLAASPTDVTFLFAEGDDGLEYLHNRQSLRLADVTASGGIHVREIPGIDHAMHRAWLRPRMFTAIRNALEAAGLGERQPQAAAGQGAA